MSPYRENAALPKPTITKFVWSARKAQKLLMVTSFGVVIGFFIWLVPDHKMTGLAIMLLNSITYWMYGWQKQIISVNETDQSASKSLEKPKHKADSIKVEISKEYSAVLDRVNYYVWFRSSILGSGETEEKAIKEFKEKYLLELEADRKKLAQPKPVIYHKIIELE